MFGFILSTHVGNGLLFTKLSGHSREHLHVPWVVLNHHMQPVFLLSPFPPLVQRVKHCAGNKCSRIFISTLMQDTCLKVNPLKFSNSQFSGARLDLDGP